ncbi:MAG: aminotransferase class I/II-fold pyridoxal phosphate-dependent enzyme [Deltaproteobacteria bacterium]|nr:aminotransferase class I/II-fold pyridoxal phosphate-dependent enzyme [Deltaproteobacteria bacterium]
MTRIIDLRSDTVTRPGQAMRAAMAAAEVGDTVYNEDPTVLALEARIARLLGKEAALYVPTGTMANILAIRLRAEPGDELVIESEAHPVYYEAGGAGAFSGALFKTVRGDRGILEVDDVARVLYAPVYYRPRQTALLLENTHNRGGGIVYPLERVKALAELARSHGLKVHMDGARLWNASVAARVPVSEYAAPCDTVSVCFSKGLGAPVGSALAGSRADIERAWHYRHMLGGSWRQAGILAAAALYALDHHVERLAKDHANAALLARGLEQLGLAVTNRVETNMVYFRHPEAEKLATRLEDAGIRTSAVEPDTIRCVTHLDVDGQDVAAALDVLKRLI